MVYFKMSMFGVGRPVNPILWTAYLLNGNTVHMLLVPTCFVERDLREVLVIQSQTLLLFVTEWLSLLLHTWEIL